MQDERECEFKVRCMGLTNHLSARPMLEAVYRSRYCHESPFRCARYAYAQAIPHAIPDDFLPNQHHRLESFGVALDGTGTAD